jgi:VCBS repeat protein/type IX secretion system substrate protein
MFSKFKSIYFYLFIYLYSFIINAQTLSFTDVAIPLSIFYGNDPGYSVAWGDYDGDGDQDLFLTLRYVPGSQESKLFRNDGNYFTDVTHVYNITTPEFYGSSYSEWVDYDNDNDLDLYINTNHTKSKLYENRINVDNTFLNVSFNYDLNDSGDFVGALWFDFDNDADMDIFLIGPISKFYKNEINTVNNFIDITDSIGLPANLSSDHCTFGDYDLDGDLDLYIANAYDPNNYFRNDFNSSGLFVELGDSLGVNDSHAGLTTVSGDYDNDGDLDIFVLNGGGSQFNNLYRNEINSGNYLFVRPTDVNGCYNRFGSKVKVYFSGTDSLIGMRVVDGGGNGGISQNQYDCHFGLDENLAYDIEVIFTTRTNGQNHIFNKNSRPQLGNYIPSQHGHFLEVRDSVVTVTSVLLEKEQEIITKFKLHQNYPNPFNPITNIKYELKQSKFVTAKIFNMLGQEIIELVNEKKKPGSYIISWDGKDNNNKQVSSGIYFCRFDIEGEIKTIKMILTK